MSRTRTRTRRAFAGFVTALAIGVLAAGCSTAAEPTSGSGTAAAGERVDGGTLRVYSDTESVDPRQQHGPWGRAIADSLIDRDPDTQEFVPWLAEEFSANEDSTEFTFKLREGVTFSNDEAFNAEAVKANFDGAVQDLGQGGGWYIRGLFDYYLETEVTDEYTAVVKFSEPNVAFLPTLATSQLAIIAPSEFQNTLEERALNGVVGTGPYVLSAINPDEGLTLTRRDEYAWPSDLAEHDGAPSLEAIEVSFVSEVGVQQGALQSGEVEAILSYTYPPDTITQLQSAGYNVNYRSQVGIGMSIEVNFNHPLTSQLAVRRALQKGIDRDEVSSLVTGETSPAASSVITAATFGHADFSDTILEYDPEGAKTVLEDDGWALGSDGIYAKDGQRLEISYITWPGTIYEDVTSLLVEQYAKIGIELKPTFNEQAPSVFTDSGEYAVHYRNTTRADPDVLRKVYSNEAHLGDPAILFQDSATVTSSGTELEETLQASSRESDPDKRAELLERAQEIILEDGLRIPVIDNGVYVVISSSTLHGLRHNSLSEPVLHELWLEQG